MNKTCIVSVAFRQPYVDHSRRQEAYLKEFHPEIDTLYYRNLLPFKGGVHTMEIVSEFQKSLYGFKVHAIQAAIDKGYKKIIWFDPCVLPTADVDILVKSLDVNPIIVKIGDSPLSKMCNQKALDYFGVTKEVLDAENVRTVGGTLYAFNFDDYLAREVFSHWKQSEEDGIFGTQDDFMAGHWADEACMALSLADLYMEFYSEQKFTYQNQKEL
jgi:hypothetical protein